METIGNEAERTIKEKYGSYTHVDTYTKDNLEAGIRKIARDMPKFLDEKNLHRAIILVSEDQYDKAQKILDSLKKELGEDVVNKINIVKGNVPTEDDQFIDEVRHVVAGKLLLNYKRYLEGARNMNEDEEVRLVAYLKSIVDDSANMDMKKVMDILNGNAILDIIAPINYNDLQEFKKAQDAILQSL